MKWLVTFVGLCIPLRNGQKPIEFLPGEKKLYSMQGGFVDPLMAIPRHLMAIRSTFFSLPPSKELFWILTLKEANICSWVLNYLTLCMYKSQIYLQ